jgi:RNA polymerase sigma factor (sigma-70 family)
VSPSPPSCNQPAGADDTRWFAEEVHAHDAALKSYLRSSFPAIRDVDDIAQESYVRLWRQRAAEPIRSAKAFLFKIAQRIALDALRRERRSPLEIAGNIDVLDVLDHAPAVADRVIHDERVRLLIEAIDSLPSRCRAVLVLRKLKLLSQRETAAVLGLSEKGVECQLARGLQRCREFMRRRGVTPASPHET